MTRSSLVVLLSLAALLSACDDPARPLPPIETYFSPHGGATDAVAREIDRAERAIFVQAYSFTSPKIAEALVRAHQRGVVVHVILDKSNRTEEYSAADFLAHSGIAVLIDAQHEIAHNKIIHLDGRTVITGSFNFTKQAENSNAENLLIIRDDVIAARYLENWHDHENHSEAYTARAGSSDQRGDEHRHGQHSQHRPR